MRSLLRFRDVQSGASSSNLRDLVSGDRRLDVDALAASLGLEAPIPVSRTLYEGITAEVLPDAWGAPADPVAPPATVPEAVALVRRALDSAVEHAIGNATRVAVLAGGGIDSAALLAVAVEVTARRGGSAFPVAIDFATEGDDRPHLRALVEHLGCEVARVTPADGAKHLDRVREGVDGAPLLWPFNALQIALFAAAKERGAQCVLAGAGGDHLFDGNPRSLSELALRHPIRALRDARHLEGFWEPRLPVFEHIVRPHLAAVLPVGLRRFIAHRRRPPPSCFSWAGPKLIEVTRRLDDRSLEVGLTHSDTASVDGFFSHQERTHFAWLVHQEQRAVGLERFDPYFTREIAATVQAIPGHLLLAGRRRRGLLREAMRGKVPASLLDRPDKALFSPAFKMLFEAAGGAATFAEELEGRTLARLGLVDSATFSAEVTRALVAPEEDGRYGQAWAAVAAEAFLLRHPELS